MAETGKMPSERVSAPGPQSRMHVLRAMMPQKEAGLAAMQNATARPRETGGRTGCLMWDKTIPDRPLAVADGDQAVIALNAAAWLSTQASNAWGSTPVRALKSAVIVARPPTPIIVSIEANTRATGSGRPAPTMP